MINLKLVFRSLEGHCHGNQFLWGLSTKLMSRAGLRWALPRIWFQLMCYEQALTIVRRRVVYIVQVLRRDKNRRERLRRHGTVVLRQLRHG